MQQEVEKILRVMEFTADQLRDGTPEVEILDVFLRQQPQLKKILKDCYGNNSGLNLHVSFMSVSQKFLG